MSCLKQSRQFFQSPVSVKQQCSINSNKSGSNVGWISMHTETLDPGRQKVKPATTSPCLPFPPPSALPQDEIRPLPLTIRSTERRLQRVTHPPTINPKSRPQLTTKPQSLQHQRLKPNQTALPALRTPGGQQRRPRCLQQRLPRPLRTHPASLRRRAGARVGLVHDASRPVQGIEREYPALALLPVHRG